MSTRMFLFLCIALVMIAGCAPSSNPMVGSSGDDVAGFWRGLWHGFTLLFTFVASLFVDDVGIYEIDNRGTLYDLGFLFGVMIFFGGSCGGAGKRSK